MNKKILWVDDEIQQLMPHKIFLEDKGYVVEGVSSGEDAIEQVKRQEFDLILLDEMMPGMDGLTTLEEIRKINKRVPVVMITKSEEERLMEDAIGREISDYLVKPVHPVQILSTLKRIFDATRILGQQLTRDYTSEYREMAMRPSMKLPAGEWLDLAYWLAEWDVIFDNHPELGLYGMHREFRHECNSEFSRYIMANYTEWVNSDRKERPRLSVDISPERVVPHLRDGKKVFFIVIDCMRLDQWLAVESMLSEHYN
ncbi:MAG: response regulator, partial [bacterium]